MAHEVLAQVDRSSVGRTDSPPATVRDALYRISLGLPLPAGAVSAAFLDITAYDDPAERDTYLAALMTGLMARGPVEDDVVELLSAALSLDEVVRCAGEPVATGSRLVVAAGSGKKGIKSHNVSTPAALVAVAAGARVAKVGSYATSSVVGSRDLAGALRLPESVTAAAALERIDAHGFAFIPIEEVIPGLDRVYGGRFHTLNPLSFGLAGLLSPLRGDVLVYGLSHPRIDLSARVLARLGVRDAMVLTSGGVDGYHSDELGLAQKSLVCEVRDGTPGPVERVSAQLVPGDFTVRPPRSLAESHRRALDVLGGDGPPDWVRLIALNAAALLVAAGVVADLSEGTELAAGTMASGRPLAKLREIQEAGA